MLAGGSREQKRLRKAGAFACRSAAPGGRVGLRELVEI